MNALAISKLYLQLDRIDGYRVRARRHQMHLNAAEVVVVAGQVAEAVEIEVAAELGVDAFEDVLVEAGGDAAAVVVGGLEY